jgi:transposase
MTVSVADAHAQAQNRVSVDKMTNVREEHTTEELRSVVLFFGAKGRNIKNILKKMCPLYCEKYLSRKAVRNWVEKVSQGRSKVADDARPGRAVEIATEATAQWVEELIRADRRITIDSVANALGCSHGLAYNIMHVVLKFRKVCARWVPREVKYREKMNRIGLSLQHLLRYANVSLMTKRLKRRCGSG